MNSDHKLTPYVKMGYKVLSTASGPEFMGFRWHKCNTVNYWYPSILFMRLYFGRRISMLQYIFQSNVAKKTFHFIAETDETLLEDYNVTTSRRNSDLVIHIKLKPEITWSYSSEYEDYDDIKSCFNFAFEKAEEYICSSKLKLELHYINIVDAIVAKLISDHLLIDFFGSQDTESLRKILDIMTIAVFPTLETTKRAISIINSSISISNSSYTQSGFVVCWDELKMNIDFFSDNPHYLSFKYDVEIKNLRDTATHLLKHSVQEAIKSAKAAIMSRNMSHNLGSHVMFYIKQKLQSVSKIVDSDVLHNILPGDISDLEEVRKQISERKGIELPFLVGLGRFINYLQERQDYIATVATDYIPSNSTISFKDFIYDELKPDLRYKRHHPEGSNSDAGWQPGNLLLDYIAYSEGYVNSNAIQISFDEFNGLNSTDNSDFDKLRKFNIAVPGGVIGRQAIFSIMENIIRNAAKHSIRREDNKISITFSQIDTMEKLYSLNQNGCTLRTKRAENADIESGEALLEKYESAMCDYHILEIKLNMLNRSRDVDALLDKLGEDYVDSAGIMKECSKGLKEMRISAAWLRGYSVDSDINPTLPPVLSVRTIPCCDDKVMFSYLICLPKPKKVAFLLEDVKEYEYLNDLLTTYGCRLYKYERDLQIQDYDLVCLGLSDETHINEIVSNVSSRIIVDSNIAEEFIKNIKTSEPNEIKAIIDGVYDSWFENWCSKSYTSLKPNLLILDEKSYKKNQQYASDFANEVILSTIGNMSDEVCHNSVVYSTHYPGISKLPEEVAKKYSNALSVESITGNNSTDRLIRQDDWNREWYNKHLHAGIVKVGIFDERIYSTFITTKSSINETSFFADCESLKNGNLKLLDFAKKYDISINDSRRLKGADHDYIRDFLASKKSVDASVAQMNRERRVWAIDLKVESDKLILKGFNSNTQDKIGMSAFDNIEDAEINIAVIEKANDGFEIKSLMGTYENPFYQTFDMISIHQGILDKIYTVLGIKDNRDEKYKVTHALHKFFMKSQTPKNEKEYLPYLVIHSGRSKPNRDDMPQKQPFVQFAAIDHAVKDCKYTLVELLTSAYYESDSNN